VAPRGADEERSGRRIGREDLKDDVDMIMLSRLNGAPFALNPDLIERAEATPDTVLTLCDGAKVLIAESVEELVERVREYRSSIISRAEAFVVQSEPAAPVLSVIPFPAREG
jgi:flagellar protein FlbD